MDVLLIQPAVSFKVSKSEYIPDCPHLGLLYLASILEKKGYSVKILDAIDCSYSLSDITNIVRSQEPKVIGITAMTMHIRGAVQLAKHLKETLKDKAPVIALGGPHISADPQVIERFPFFDLGVTGEAEITFPRLVDRIMSKVDGNAPRGLFNSEVPFNLDDIPFPARHLIDWQEFRTKRNYWSNPIIATRGCPHRCNFCSIPAISKKVRYRSPSNVIAEMEETYRITKEEVFSFIDDSLTIKKSYIYELCDSMKNLSFNPRWEAQTRASYVDEDLLKRMKAAGCYKLLFGVETGSETIRNQVIHKNITDQQIASATAWCNKVGIEPDWYLMLGHPTETKEDLQKTIEFSLKHSPNIIGIHITMPLPGSPLFEEAIREGIIEPDTIDKYILGAYGEGYKNCWPYYIPRGLTHEDLVQAQREGYRRFYFRGRYILRRLIRDVTSVERLRMDFIEGLSLLFRGRAEKDATN